VSKLNYVIIGNSAAAIGCIEGIRQVDKKGEITIISDEAHHTYSRPLISYLLKGKTDRQKMKYRPESFYDDNKVKTVFGKAVTKIDKNAKKVVLEDNREINYDKLLVATGSAPFVPPITGLDTVTNKFTFMTLDDEIALEKAITEDSRVLIVGAGLIGLKCAEGLHHKVKSLTVIDLANRILPSILDETGSDIMKAHIESEGVEFILSDSIAELSASSAILKSGNRIDFDVLVVAVGVRPNTKLVSDAGGEVVRGIKTDELLQTNIPDVYAAGDCTESWDIASEENRILALLPNAYMQGECAGINMAGGEKPYKNAIPMNAIGFFGLHIITAGSYDGDEYIVKGGKSYKKLITKDNLLKGYILIENIERAGIYTSLIREKTPLDTIDFELIKDKPQLMAFSKNVRKEKLGGIQQ
jgi:NAD(P)H-nitrite reductase large subunit